MAVKTTIKWGKEKLDFEVDPAWTGEQFKARVQARTSVPPYRQKLSCPKAWKGALDDATTLAG